MAYEFVGKFEALLKKTAPYMQNTVTKARDSFGGQWEQRFNETLEKFYLDDEPNLENAVKGYVRFALDAIKLQKKFEKDLEYIPKSYADAAKAVYHNEDYMYSLYLPGILLSHYLWPHHYRQLLYFYKKFMPLISALDDKTFADIGIGSGFYSRQILTASSQMSGQGFDISDYSINYAKKQMAVFNLSDRWQVAKRDVVIERINQDWPVIVSVEVLEHLEDPLSFIRAIRGMLRKGGYGFITAAITAPNEDHIYLYNNCEEVIDQLREGGFKIIDYLEEAAYKPKKDEPVPRLGAFIVQ